jgi:gamma-glutamyltranspeptidase/glutathione hydrolase
VPRYPVLCLMTLFSAGILHAAPLVQSKVSMIVTNNPWASKTAQEILAAGGNAVDAAIAASFVLGLTEPASSGIGGGGYAITYSASNKQLWAYDGRETAPHTAKPDWFLDKNGKPMEFMSAVLSAKSIGVPSQIALLYKLHQDQGKLSWKQLLAPAIRIAEAGFPLSQLLHDELNDEAVALKKSPAVVNLFFQNDKVKNVGSVIKNPAYANTLRIIAENPTDFYQGKLAGEIIADINQAANASLFNLQDFSSYQVKRNPPVCAPYRSQYEICSVPPSSSGGVTSQELMSIYALQWSQL